MTRPLASDLARTVVFQVDVLRAFADEEERPTRQGIQALVPLDTVPVLTGAPALLPWDALGVLARRLVRQIDGVTPTMRIVTSVGAPPAAASRELASLVRRGLVKLGGPRREPLALDIDLSGL